MISEVAPAHVSFVIAGNICMSCTKHLYNVSFLFRQHLHCRLSRFLLTVSVYVPEKNFASHTHLMMPHD
jgi:hypothetical protein